MEMRIELLPVPVSDTDRAKDFYVNKVGFNSDHDVKLNDDLRFVQLTPPGSKCSIVIGEGTTEMTPGTQKKLQMVIEDADQARKELVERGVDATEIEELPWGRFVYFSDPDGNSWALQQIVKPG